MISNLILEKSIFFLNVMFILIFVGGFLGFVVVVFLKFNLGFLFVGFSIWNEYMSVSFMFIMVLVLLNFL